MTSNAGGAPTRGERVEVLGVTRHHQGGVEIVQTPALPTQLSVYVALSLGLLLAILGISSLGGSAESSTPEVSDPVFMQERIGAAGVGLLTNATPAGEADFLALYSVPDHDPYVFGYPRPEVQLLGRRTGLAVIYVNTLGRPTVVDLDTGMIHELEVAAHRTYDRFGIEDGDVVATGTAVDSREGGNERMITFHVHIRGDQSGDLGDSGQHRPGPHLCLSNEGCPDLGWTAESYARGADTAQMLNEENYAELFAVMAGPWDRGSRHSLAGFGPDFSLRMPTPVNDVVWVAHQP